MVDYTAALKILRDLDAEERNWRAARAKIGELLEAAMAAQKTLEEMEDSRIHLQETIEGMSKGYDAERSRLQALVEKERSFTDAEITRLQNSMRTIQHEADEQEKCCTNAEEAANVRLAELNGQIAEKEKALHLLTESFDKFKLAHGLV